MYSIKLESILAKFVMVETLAGAPYPITVFFCFLNLRRLNFNFSASFIILLLKILNELLFKFFNSLFNIFLHLTVFLKFFVFLI